MPAFPSVLTTSVNLGRAMLHVIEGRTDQLILEQVDISRVDA